MQNIKGVPKCLASFHNGCTICCIKEDADSGNSAEEEKEARKDIQAKGDFV